MRDRELGLGRRRRRCLSSQRRSQRTVATRRGPGEAVRLVGLEEVDALAVAEPAVDQLRLAEGVPAPLDVEEVARADAQEGRLGGPHGHVVGVVHAEGDLAGDVLLGVLRADRGEEPLERGDVARRAPRRRSGRRGPSGRRSACRRRSCPCSRAGVASISGRLGEVVEAADAVPDPVGRGLAADEHRADAGHRVLGRAPWRIAGLPSASSIWTRSPWPIGS